MQALGFLREQTQTPSNSFRFICFLQVILWTAYQIKLIHEQSCNILSRGKHTSSDEEAILLRRLALDGRNASRSNATAVYDASRYSSNTENGTALLLSVTNDTIAHPHNNLNPSATIVTATASTPAQELPLINSNLPTHLIKLIRKQQMDTIQWETRVRNLNRSHDIWAERAKLLRERFAQQLGRIVSRRTNQALLAKAQRALFTDIPSNATTQQDPFANILVAVDLPAAFMRQPNGSKAMNMKAVVGLDKLLSKLPPATCTIYGAGLDYQSAFEKSLAARTQCAVHTFDCTLTSPERLGGFLRHQNRTLVETQIYHYRKRHKGKRPSRIRPNLAYHPWCLGDPNINSNASSSLRKDSHYDASAVDQGNTFTLDRIMLMLNHKQRVVDHNATQRGGVDFLKFDIEGYEWTLFDMLLNDKVTDPTTLPLQISFELHTQGANRRYVPEHAVAGRTAASVSHLFQLLWNLGYRVVYKEVNDGDHACAEFVVYRFFGE